MRPVFLLRVLGGGSRADCVVSSPSGGDEDEDAPLKAATKPVIDGEEGIEQKKKKKKEIQYPLLADVSDAAQYAFLGFFTVLNLPSSNEILRSQDNSVCGNQNYPLVRSVHSKFHRPKHAQRGMPLPMQNAFVSVCWLTPVSLSCWRARSLRATSRKWPL